MTRSSDLLGLVKRVGEKSPTQFIAPIPDARNVFVRTIQDQVPYRLLVENGAPGWWILDPKKDKTNAWTRAEPVGAAMPADTIRYLRELPKFNVIVVSRCAESVWLCVPFNISDAAQRGWANGQPRRLHLVSEAIQPMDVVVVRSLGGTLLYDEINTRLDVAEVVQRAQRVVLGESIAEKMPSEFALAAGIYRSGVAKLEPDREVTNIPVAGPVDQMRWQLEFMGARLLSHIDRGENIEVEWEYDGCTYKMNVARDTMIESAGICLNGTDSAHNLSSIVSVMERARREQRFDLPEEYHL